MHLELRYLNGTTRKLPLTAQSVITIAEPAASANSFHVGNVTEVLIVDAAVVPGTLGAPGSEPAVKPPEPTSQGFMGTFGHGTTVAQNLTPNP